MRATRPGRKPGLATERVSRPAAGPAGRGGSTSGTGALRAGCRDADPDLFFSFDPADIAQAQQVCAGCPVTAQCHARAEANDEQFGVWAGIDRDARHAERKSLMTHRGLATPAERDHAAADRGSASAALAAVAAARDPRPGCGNGTPNRRRAMIHPWPPNETGPCGSCRQPHRRYGPEGGTLCPPAVPKPNQKTRVRRLPPVLRPP